MNLLNAYIHQDDVSIIRSLSISRYPKQESYGYHFTDHGWYTVKSSHSVEKLYPDLGSQQRYFGPDTKSLVEIYGSYNAHQITHFVWQVISLPFTKNLRSRGFKCDMQYQICGAEEESINHVLFEYPPAFQTWLISNIPSHPWTFPSPLMFINMDYLFWRLPKEPDLKLFSMNIVVYLKKS